MRSAPLRSNWPAFVGSGWPSAAGLSHVAATHHRRFSPEQLLGSDNDFYDLEIGLCDTAVLVNYSIANRFHNFIIGAVHTGFRLNFTNQIDIYSPTIEAFHVGIDASYGASAPMKWTCRCSGR